MIAMIPVEYRGIIVFAFFLICIFIIVIVMFVLSKRPGMEGEFRKFIMYLLIMVLFIVLMVVLAELITWIEDVGISDYWEGISDYWSDYWSHHHHRPSSHLHHTHTSNNGGLQ